MESWDDRGQSIQVGAVLLFGALVVALATYQAAVVPQQNERTEFSHSQQVQDELGELRNAIASVPGASASRSVSVTLGTRYQGRLVAVNPGPPTGQLRTAGTGDDAIALAIENATAAGEVGDVWDGSRRTVSTGGLVYRPDYNVYQGAPATVYENGVLYNQFPGATVPVSGQTLVEGKTVSLVALNGSLGETKSGATTVDVRPVSASTTAVSVENESASERVTVRAPTRLDESAWEELLADQTVSEGGYVTDVAVRNAPATSEFDELVVSLKAGETYELRMAKAGVGTRVTGETAAYATDAAGNGSSVPEAGSTRLAVEVRDRFNNPVSGVAVTGDAAVGSLGAATATTDEDGRATFRYEAPSVSRETTVSVNFSYDVDPRTAAAFDADAPENVGMVVEVQNTQVSGGSGGGGGAPHSLEWTSPEVRYEHDVGSDGDSLTMWAVLEDAVGDSLENGSVDGASVDFAVNNSTVASVSPGDAVTDHEGAVSTTLTAREEGTVRVYAVSGGASDVVNVTVTNVSTGTPRADFTYSPSSPTVSDTVSFTDQSTDDGTIDTWAWDFDGDGTTDSTDPNPDHAYTSGGTYTVELNVTDDADDYDTVTKTVTVSDDTAPSVTVQDPDGGESIAGGSTYTISWSASDGESGIASDSVVLEYSADGGSPWNTIATNEADDGSYDWSVPAIDTTDALVRVSVDDQSGNTGSDTSDGPFTIDSSAPTISATSISDVTDGDGVVSDGDSVRVTATVSDTESGVASVTADASAFGAGTVTLTDGNGDGIYDETFTVGSGGTASEGDQSATVTATDGVDNSGSTSTGTLEVDTTAPSIGAVSLDEDGSGNLQLSFDSDESLDSIAVRVDGPNTADVYAFDETDFSESGTGPYTYTLTTTQAYDDGDGTYEATVDDAVDVAGNNGGENGAGSGLSDSYVYSSPGSPPPIQNGIRYDGGLSSTSSNSAIRFDITNVGGTDARISAVRITSTVADASHIWNTGSPGSYGHEVYVTGGASDAHAEAGNPDNFKPEHAAYPANGSRISWSTGNARLSTSSGGDSATFTAAQFGRATGNSFHQYDFSTLNRVSSSDAWDVRIVLEFQSRGDVTFYFQES